MSYLNQKEYCIRCNEEVDKREASISLKYKGIIVCSDCQSEEAAEQNSKYREEIKKSEG